MRTSQIILVMISRHYLDVFTQPIRQEFDSIEHPELRELAESLPEIVLRSRAPSTVKKYGGAFLRWKRWALYKCADIQLLPAKRLHVSLYLAFLIQ